MSHVEIMEERYEICEKIGQGGLGAVYRGYDHRMSREVAIKRIPVTNDALQEESTRQLLQEAGALASLQHPHIVTIYDVGSDQDGPYVVMELISGKTLDELIERAPLTWSDFRELALQTQEALIAAQELSLIHGDIKPSNLMLTWLPSGKFHMKIVDFGLATLAHSQSSPPDNRHEADEVFGSIFFMAPEQFERAPLDARVDMYAMGCVYYQSLTGSYPFQGETGHEVMTSHLDHRVSPLQNLRADIPVWACDWIMWMINRMPPDRPASAREALQVFLQNDKNPNPTLSLGRVAPLIPVGPRAKRPALDPATTPTIGEEPVPENASRNPAGLMPLESPRTLTAPQPLLPPEGSKPSVYTASHRSPPPLTPTPTPRPLAKRPPLLHTPKPKSGNPLKAAGAVFFIGVIIVLGILLFEQIQQSKASRHFEDLLAQAQKGHASGIPMSGPELDHFLEAATHADTPEKQSDIFKLLTLAQPNDSSDFGANLARFAATSTQLLPEVREALIRDVIALRINPSMVAILLEFARTTRDSTSAITALRVIRSVSGDDQFDALLTVVQFHPNKDLRKAAEEVTLDVLKRSRQGTDLGKRLGKALEGSTDSKVRDTLLRLIAAHEG
jgi:serine/threonine protein kinase